MKLANYFIHLTFADPVVSKVSMGPLEPTDLWDEWIKPTDFWEKKMEPIVQPIKVTWLSYENIEF